MKQVSIYSTPACSYCKMAKEFFLKNNIEFTDIDVSTNTKASEEMVQKTGQIGVPVVVINENGNEDILIGFEMSKYKKFFGI